MNEILVEIAVPVIGRAFDVFLPQATRFNEIAGLVGTAVARLSEGQFLSKDAALFLENGAPVDINQTPAQLKLKNGAKLLYI